MPAAALRYHEGMTTWVLLAGLPATGKSTLAQALLPHLTNTTVLDKDRVRAALFPNGMTDYSSEQDDLCMHAMLSAAAYITQHRQADFIFFDGRTFSRRSQIDIVLQAADTAGATWRILHLTCSDEAASRRLHAVDTSHPAGNRDIDLYRRMKAGFEPIPYTKLDLDTTDGVESLLSRVLEYLRS
jgi:predicted kinase